MENEVFLKQMQNFYDSLKSFSIIDNKLIFHHNKEYKFNLTYTKLANLNRNLFLLNSLDIFHIIYMLELLPKTNLTDEEILFVESYTKKYLKLNDLALENDKIDKNVVWGFSIPIFSSYDKEYLDSPCSKTIQRIIINHSKDIENSQDKHPRLVLTNPNFLQNEENDNNLANIEKAGFTTLFLIASAISATCLYIIYFIANH